MKHVQVWDQENGTFCVIAKYNGSFVTVAGKSPSGVANVSGGVTGTMEGGYSGVITGAFNPGTKRTKGNIGAKDYACTITDGKAIDCSYFDWVGKYLTGSFSYDSWGWIYKRGRQRHVGQCRFWKFRRYHR